MDPLLKSLATGAAGEGTNILMNRLKMHFEIPWRCKSTLAIFAAVITRATRILTFSFP
jgi:hypothetical protein